jgi:alpha-1,6-mannosyltransferase
MLLSVFMTALSTVVSHYNYPGGYALARFNNIIAQRDCHVGCPPVTVHMDVLACMTGVTRFGELVNVSDVHYNKTEGPISLDDFDWLIHATPR